MAGTAVRGPRPRLLAEWLLGAGIVTAGTGTVAITRMARQRRQARCKPG